MKRLALLALGALACASEPAPAPGIAASIDRRVALPEGAALSPDDPSRPGEAGPGALALAKGHLYALLQNLNRYTPAGPSHLAILDPDTLELQGLHPITLSGRACRNATSLLATDHGLLVTCAGNIALPPDVTSDGMLAELDFDGRVLRLVDAGRSPGGLARVGDDVWMGDGEGGGLSHVSLASFEVLAGTAGAGMVEACEAGPTKSGFVSDVLAFGGRLFATCFNDDTVLELDPRTGQRLGAALATGAGPLRMAAIGPRLYILDDLGGTMTILDPGPPAATQRAAVRLGRDDDQGGNDPQGLAGDEQLVGVTNSAYGTFVLVELGSSPRVAASVDLKATPDAPTNFPTAVAYDGRAFFVAIPGLELSSRSVPSELVRVTWERSR